MPLAAFAAIPLLASLVLSYRADRGTVYIAADSRLTSPVGALPVQPTPDDTACKIRVFPGGVVFVGSGDALFSIYRLRTNIYTVAASAAARLPPGPLALDDIRDIALAWQRTVHARLAAKLRAQSQSVRSSEPVNTAQSTVGTTGSFYAVIADGTIYAITLRVALAADGVLRNIEEPQAQPGYLIATGTNEAKQRALAFALAEPAVNLAWPGRLEAIEQETIGLETARYGRNSDIGGPIDMVEITTGGPRWLQRKAACK